MHNRKEAFIWLIYFLTSYTDIQELMNVFSIAVPFAKGELYNTDNISIVQNKRKMYYPAKGYGRV